MSDPVYNLEQVVIDPVTNKFVPSVDPTGGTYVQSYKVTIEGLLADATVPGTYQVWRGYSPLVWEEITKIKPSSAILYVMAN